MSALTCGCDPEVFYMCAAHRYGGITAGRAKSTPRPEPTLYESLHSALCDASNSVQDVLADIPAERRYDSTRLLWTRLDKSIDEAMERLQALEAHDARALAER